MGLAPALAAITWYLTIRGRGESARVVFTMLAIFVLLTIVMAIGLFIAKAKGVPAAPYVAPDMSTHLLWQAIYHMLTASMKGLVALERSGSHVEWHSVRHQRRCWDGQMGQETVLPRFKGVWDFYSGKSGIGRMVQTSFLFYGGLTTAFLAYFAIHFNVFDGTLGRSLVGNLAFIGFGQIPGGQILYWAYQILAVALLAAASMTAFQDLQATAWRDVAIGEIPEIVVYRNPAGTFTRSVTAGFIVAVIIQLIVRGDTSAAVPYYGIGVFMPIMVMGFAIRKHILATFTGQRAVGQPGRWFCWLCFPVLSLSGRL